MNYINYNGEILEKDNFSLDLSNRAFRFGDSIFETIRVFNGKIIFLDKHYSRLVKSLEIIRISIPDYFTKDYMNTEILNLVNKYEVNGNARIRLTVFRKSNNDIYFVDKHISFDFLIECSLLTASNFVMGEESYVIDVFSDIKKQGGILSQMKSNNVLLHSIAGSLAKEKSVNNIVLVNEEDYLSEAVNSNIFLIRDKVIYTPKLSDGCVEGIMRNNVIEIIKQETNYSVVVKSIDKSELLKCDEVFLTNSIIGIQSVDKYRTVSYSKFITNEIQKTLIRKINSLLGQMES